MTDLLRKRPRHELKLLAAEGRWGGPSYDYRGARIECAKGAHVCGLFLDGHPLTGHSFGVVGTVTPLVDVWLDERRLPPHIVSAAGYRRENP
jgi:hypothetical protein